MKINVEIQILSFDELSQQAKEKAVLEHLSFLSSIQDPYQGEFYEIDDQDVIDSIRLNKYLFYSDGSLADVIHYKGRQQRSGKIILTHDNKEYDITSEYLQAQS